jgi:hypothetical protein
MGSAASWNAMQAGTAAKKSKLRVISILSQSEVAKRVLLQVRRVDGARAPHGATFDDAAPGALLEYDHISRQHKLALFEARVIGMVGI